MQVVDDLPSLGTDIAAHTIAALSVPRLFTQDARGLDAAAHHPGVLSGEPRDGLDVPLGDDEEMDGRLGIDVLEGEHLVVFVLDVRRRLARHDTAEDAVRAHESSSAGVYSPLAALPARDDPVPRR